MKTALRSTASSSTGAGPFPFRRESAYVKLTPASIRSSRNATSANACVTSDGDAARQPVSSNRVAPTYAAHGPRLPPHSAVPENRSNEPPDSSARSPAWSKPFFRRSASVPPRAFRPKAGSAPALSCASSIANCGIRSNCTVSPNGSLIRTPCWWTATPCGSPRSGDAVKPRNRSVGWNRLVVVPSSVTAPSRSWSVSASDDACRSMISPAVRTETVAGIRSRLTPSPTGATPTTSTRCANGATASCTSTVRASPAATATPVRRAVRNPAVATVTAYVPGASAGSRYAPSVPVAATAGAAPGAVAVTSAPATAAPRASVTRPAIVAVCARASTEASAASRRPAARRRAAAAAPYRASFDIALT